MTEIHPAKKLAELLEQASSEDRQAIAAWLFETRTPWSPRIQLAPDWLGQQFRTVLTDRPLRALSPGEDNQLVTVRLPQDLHSQMRDWCAEHGFSMAAVIRGLIERFLDHEGQAGAEAKSSTDPES